MGLKDHLLINSSIYILWINRTSKFAYVELLEQYGKTEVARFLRNLIAAVPYHIYTVLTGNGIQFTNRKKHQWAFAHIFDRVCHERENEHRLTKVNHPWANGQVEPMNRTLKEATVIRYYNVTTMKTTSI